jgi:hypothetical protein
MMKKLGMSPLVAFEIFFVSKCNLFFFFFVKDVVVNVCDDFTPLNFLKCGSSIKFIIQIFISVFSDLRPFGHRSVPFCSHVGFLQCLPSIMQLPIYTAHVANLRASMFWTFLPSCSPSSSIPHSVDVHGYINDEVSKFHSMSKSGRYVAS